MPLFPKPSPLIRTILALILSLGSPAAALAYVNPILPAIRDPDTILMDGLYHLVEPGGQQGSGGFFNYRASRDLVHWSEPIRILRQQPGIDLWQGSYYQDIGGQLYFYYTAVDMQRNKTIHVVAAASPTGPFSELGVVTGGIDPYPFRDEDGSLWLYYKDDRAAEKGIWVQRMAGPAQRSSDPPVELLHPQPGTFEDGGYLTVEGPTLIKRAGRYFLLYSGGPFGAPHYAVGYAVATRPDGPFIRAPNNPILTNSRSPNVYSPGVPSVVADGAGALWLVYRQRATSDRRSPRQLAIDPLDVSLAAGGLLAATPTRHQSMPDPVPLP